MRSYQEVLLWFKRKWETTHEFLETHWNVGKCWEPFLDLHISPKMVKTVSEPSTIPSVLQVPLLSCCLITTLRPWQNGQNRQPQREIGLAQPLPWQIKTESPRKILVHSFMDTSSFKWPWDFLRLVFFRHVSKWTGILNIVAISNFWIKNNFYSNLFTLDGYFIRV